MLPVTATFIQGPPGTPAGAPTTLFDVSVAWGVALFLFLSAGFHWLVSAPGVFGRYIAGLERQHNYFRWAEYSLSSSIMIVLIAMLTGISDIAALIAIFAANAAMIFFGAVQERYEKPGGSLWPFWMGCIVGIAPWLAVGVYLWSPGSAAEPPAFVYAIFVSLFIFFNIFAINMWLQYRRARPLALLHVRRGDLLHPQPGRQVGPGLAGLRRHAGRLMTGCAPWHDAPMVCS